MTHESNQPKKTTIEDLAPRELDTETAEDVKGGATAEPCFRAPRTGTPRLVIPCVQPGTT
jgi:hypothetical protein